MKKKRFKVTGAQLILLGFAAMILVGALLLMLPVSSKERVWTSFIDALFTQEPKDEESAEN